MVMQEEDVTGVQETLQIQVLASNVLLNSLEGEEAVDRLVANLAVGAAGVCQVL